MDVTAPKRDQLSDAKRALLARRLRGEAAGAGAPTAIPARPAAEPAVASFAQERVWFLQQLDPASTAYTMHEAYRVRGALDLDALRQAWVAVYQRHAVLQTIFTTEGGQLLQQTAPAAAPDLRVEDLRHLPAEAREAAARHLAAAEARRAFDLTTGPLARLGVIQLDAAEHWLLLTIHHIISDEWSNGVLWRELAAHYQHVRATGRPADLPALPIQYADFAHWQRGWLSGEAHRAQLAYWKQRLSGDLPLLQLPADRPRPAAQTYRGALTVRTLPATLLPGLHALAQQANATPFMVLLALFNVLLYRYTGQTDLLVGTPIANRNRPEVQDLMGFFLNTVVIRSAVRGDQPFRELLANTRLTALEAFANQDLPFERLVEALQPKRDLSYNPLFQAMFVYQQHLHAPFQAEGLTAAPVWIDGGVSKFDLTFFAVEAAHGLETAVEYSTDLFDAATIDRLLTHFETLLTGLLADPAQTVGRLPLLPEAERERLLHTWNQTPHPVAQAQLIHHLFEAHAARTPDAPAVLFGDHTLTYGALDARANQLAHYLRGLGVGPGAPVALCVERSLEMVVGLMGILKAGGAYVPLDPAYPPERQAFMLEDVGAAIVLTQAQLAPGLPATAAQVVALDAHWPQIAAAPTTALASGATPEDLAYVIYTSGSTGQPKGVPIRHRNLVHSTTARFIFYPEPAERYLLLSSFAFDSSVAGIFWALCQGGALCLPAPRAEQDVHQIISLIERWRVTHSLCLPSLYALVLEFARPDQLASLRAMIVAGEACTPPVVRRHYATVPAATLYNEYGPTEGTVWATAYRMPPGLKQTVPIGRPIPNMQTYVLDAERQPAPIGVVGELYIGGEGVAEGYLNRPALTAEKFVLVPALSPRPLYRTGDLARYLPDGNLEFLGRVDHQIKVRGHRVELEELEAVILQHPAVREAVALALPDARGDGRLAGFVAPQAGRTVEAGALQAFLRQKLPAYLVPDTLTVLPALPLTPNGKVDRAALATLTAVAGDRAEGYVAPRNEMEAELAALWEQLLNVRPIGLRDNFFQLGGHSLLAARMFAEIDRRYDLKLPVASLFRDASLEHLAKLIGQHKGYTDWYPIVSLQMRGAKPPFYLLHSLGGCVGDYRIWSDFLGADQPFFGIGARGYGIDDPFETIEQMAAYYITELKSIQPEGPYCIGGYEFGGVVAFEMAQQLWAQGHTDTVLVVINTEAPRSDYRRARLSPQFVARFLSNLPHWLRDYAQLGPAEQWARLRRRLTRRATTPTPESVVVDEIVIKRANLMAANLRALAAYQPQPYPGLMTVVRTARQPLVCSFDPTLGWQTWAEQPVETRVVPGSPTTILNTPPYARAVAQQLAASLRRAQPLAASGGAVTG